MRKQQAEANVLDRVLYLLEERSVMQLMKEDDKFADYIAALYATINTQSINLRGAAS